MNALIIYFSKYGQTKKIADRLVEVFEDRGHHAIAIDISTDVENSFSLDEFEVVIMGSPIYLKKHSRLLANFIKYNREKLNQKKVTAFYSVSLSASGDESQQADAQNCLDQFLESVSWSPTLKTVFAGGLHYRKYGWLTRCMMKWIASKSGGDTDTSKDFEYTDWKSVLEFANEILSKFQASSRDESEIQPQKQTQETFAAS